jgi:mannose-6-phosphate isomerase-like protein (cupin superfamily)
VDEIWYFLNGRGEMWRKQGDHEKVVPVDPDVCITIPVGTHFQFRSFGYEPLAALGVTMPPWPGMSESYMVEGKWEPTVPSGLA